LKKNNNPSAPSGISKRCARFRLDHVVKNQRTASTFSLATQLFDQHSRRSDFKALAVIFLEGNLRLGFSGQGGL
jgi:hypothetical protein